MRWLPPLIAAMALLAFVTGARAQDQRAFSIQNFQAAPGYGSFFTVEGASVPDGLAIRVGGFANYQYQPLMVRGCERVEGGDCVEWSDGGTALVAHHLTLEPLGAISMFGLLEVGIALPIVLYQEGEDVQVAGGSDVVEAPSSHAGISDIRLHIKLDLLSGVFGYEGDTFGLALIPVITFPVGNAVVGNSFMGDTSVTVHPKLAFGAQLGRVRLGANAGYIWRKEQEFLLADVGPRISYGAAGGFQVNRSWEIMLELFGQSSVDADPVSSPLEADAGAKYSFDNGLAVTGGMGVGIIGGVGTPTVRAFAGLMWSPVLETDKDGDRVLDKDDKCPEVPEDRDGFEDNDGCPDDDNDKDGIPDSQDECPDDPEDVDGHEDEDGCPDDDRDGDGIPDSKDKCPEEAEDEDGFEDEDGCPDEDNDKDGIPDSEDKCPEEAEDKDGFEDEDGCPDEDNDKDRIIDSEDKCPDEKETYNGFDDQDGCPDEGDELVKMRGSKIELLQKISFKTNSDKIVKKQSFSILDVVARVFERNPKMEMRIEGHTDSKGKRDHNLDLSQRRADAVKSYLVKKGIDEKRLEAIGHGPDKPIEDNKTRKGRAANRRVEFHITND